MELGDLDTAIRSFEESAKARPHFKTLELLGECFLKCGQHREAIIPLAAAVGLGTKPHRALYLLAQALYKSGYRSEALEKLNNALEIRPDYAHARELRKEILSPGL